MFPYRINGVAVFMLLGLTAPLTAVPIVPPLEKIPAAKWELQKGKTFYQTVTAEAEQTMKVLGNDVNQKQTQVFFYSWTPVAQDKQGNWKIKQRIEGLKMEVELAGNKSTFDSTKPGGGANNPFMGALVGAELELTLNPKWKSPRSPGRKNFSRS